MEKNRTVKKLYLTVGLIIIAISMVIYIVYGFNQLASRDSLVQPAITPLFVSNVLVLIAAVVLLIIARDKMALLCIIASFISICALCVFALRKTVLANEVSRYFELVSVLLYRELYSINRDDKQMKIANLGFAIIVPIIIVFVGILIRNTFDLAYREITFHIQAGVLIFILVISVLFKRRDQISDY